jgi:methylenetetrahydrofolate reductase (NADPH)
VRFVDECEKNGIRVAIVPGIMPITNYKQLARFSDGCGAEIPRWIRKRLEGFGDDLDSIRLGFEVTCSCAKTAGQRRQACTYTRPRRPTSRIWKQLGL